VATRDVYTHGHHDSVLRSHRWRTAENSAGYLLPHLSPGMSLLDVGCGPGTITLDLARRVTPGRVVGVDLSTDVIEQAARAARTEGLEGVELVVGDFHELDQGGFDVVHAHQVLQHLSDPVGSLRAMRRLARPGGIVAVRDSDYPAMLWAPAYEALERWREVYLAVTRHNRAHADAGRHLLRWAHEAGLVDARYSTSTWTYATGADRSWWGELWAERSTASAFAEQAVDYGIATQGDVADIAAAWREWAAEPHGVFVVVHGEAIAGA
jgi:2-polyprenyl-3-methyl-5-hydroxy-6-metoxy-1,4-benzoquinol methylase